MRICLSVSFGCILRPANKDNFNIVMGILRVSNLKLCCLGSHGAGLPSETLTPLVVWGSGAEKHQEKPTSLSTQNQELTRCVITLKVHYCTD